MLFFILRRSSENSLWKSCSPSKKLFAIIKIPIIIREKLKFKLLINKIPKRRIIKPENPLKKTKKYLFFVMERTALPPSKGKMGRRLKKPSAKLVAEKFKKRLFAVFLYIKYNKIEMRILKTGAER